MIVVRVASSMEVISATNVLVWSYFEDMYHFTSIEYTLALPKTGSAPKSGVRGRGHAPSLFLRGPES